MIYSRAWLCIYETERRVEGAEIEYRDTFERGLLDLQGPLVGATARRGARVSIVARSLLESRRPEPSVRAGPARLQVGVDGLVRVSLSRDRRF
jgi:hypothetical protein